MYLDGNLRIISDAFWYLISNYYFFTGYEQIRLPEDAVLSEFTPLMHNVQEPTFVSKDFDMELAQYTLRINKLLFFGTVFLCGLEPPVLKLEIENENYNEYVSVVRTSSSRSSPPSPPELVRDLTN